MQKELDLKEKRKERETTLQLAANAVDDARKQLRAAEDDLQKQVGALAQLDLLLEEEAAPAREATGGATAVEDVSSEDAPRKRGRKPRLAAAESTEENS